MTRRYWNVLALSRTPDNRLTPIQIQKALFLISQNLPIEVGSAFYRFGPYNYGPFDAQVYRDLDEVIEEGLVSRRILPARDWQEYEATLPGLELGRTLADSMGAESLDYIDRVLAWVRETPFADLLRAIYSEYPEFAVNSVFKDTG